MRRNLIGYLWGRYSRVMLFFAFLFFCLFLMFTSEHFVSSQLRKAFVTVTTPFIAFKHHTTSYFNLRTENELLIKENLRLKSLNKYVVQNLWDSTTTNAYKHVLPFSHYDTSYVYIPARVINARVDKHHNLFTLNRGEEDGVEVEMGVLHPDGVVGVVVEVSSHFCIVRPLVHRKSKQSACIKGQDAFGVLSWEEGNRIGVVQLQDIPRQVTPKQGDQIVTTSYSGIFPAGIPLGNILSCKPVEGSNFWDIEVGLAVDFSSLDHVTIIGNSYLRERIELEGDML